MHTGHVLLMCPQLDTVIEATRYESTQKNIMRTANTLEDVVGWGLCTGCGACSYNCRAGVVELVNIPEVGIRPQFESCSSCTSCLSICPGYNLDGTIATGA